MFSKVLFMSADNAVQLERIQNALQAHYAPPKAGARLVKGQELIEMLDRLPALSIDEHIDPMLVQLQKHHPGVSLQPEDHTLLAFIDDAFREILSRTDLDFRIEAYLRDLAPYAAVIALNENIMSIINKQHILSVLDMLVNECLGWSEDLGFLGEQFMEKVGVIITALANRRISAEQALEELSTYFEKESAAHSNREESLIEREMKVLALQRAKHQATLALNHSMGGHQLPMFVIFFLQGAWHSFLQSVVSRYGDETKHWSTAIKFTDALVTTMVASAKGEKVTALRTTLPAQIRTFCDALAIDTTDIQNSLGDIEAELESILSGEPSDPCDFELLDVDESMLETGQITNEKMIEQIENLKDGQWFLYDDKTESAEKVARVKLLLNWQDSKQLMFTNHNRRKVMQMTYNQFAGAMSNNTLTLLSPRYSANEAIRLHLVKVVNQVQAQKRKEITEEEDRKRQELAKAYRASREQDISEAVEIQAQEAQIKQERAQILRKKADHKKAAADSAIEGLKPNAWLKLPIMEGTLTPCKLAAILPGNSKYVFVNRAGIKIAEYTPGQLSHLLVTENSEILDTGTEFESVLASVVMGLRADKGKSYDELTGQAN